MGDLWTFKYEPKEFEDMILNEDIKPKLRKVIEDEVPNLMLYGTAGVGKGTFTNILIEKTGYDHMWLNASDETGIDIVRDKVAHFSTSMPLTQMQLCILNESDSLTHSGKQNAQKMLKQLMEDVHKITRFIFLTNNINEMLPELRSRCWVIGISNPPIKEIAKHALTILRNENIEFDGKDVLDIVKKCYPDIRKTIWALHENVIDGKLSGSMISATEALNKKLLQLVIDKDIEELRKELRGNYVDYVELYYYCYENAGMYKKPGQAILEIGEHLNRHGRYPVPEINFMRMVMSMMYQKIV
jgi:DNA polymerase III delta prime subunit